MGFHLFGLFLVFFFIGIFRFCSVVFIGLSRYCW